MRDTSFFQDSVSELRTEPDTRKTILAFAREDFRAVADKNSTQKVTKIPRLTLGELRTSTANVFTDIPFTEETLTQTLPIWGEIFS